MAIYRGTGATGTGGESDFAQLAQDAEAAAAAAQLAETNAETAEANAELAETNAETAATNAANSASAASTSATNAASSATSASNSASTATTQATNAANSATAAATSASNASTSATNAANSATSASTSASTATTQATNAANSATAAASSASSASTSATNSASSASTATTQATNAANSATAATTSATNASNSASAAATSATNAANSATSASTSATSAAASASSAAAIVTGVASNRPSIRPSLLLDFANTKQLDPRVTFSRASTGAYYDGKTVVKAEENLLTYSQDFDSAAWTNIDTTDTANTTAAPDGTTTADTVREAATTNVHLISNFSSSFVVFGLRYAFSVFAKKGTGATAPDVIQLSWASSTTGFATSVYANFDLSSGTVTSSGAGAVSTAIVNTGNGWYRCILIADANASTAAGLGVFFVNNNPTATRAPSYAGATTSDVYIWGAQLEQRSTATAYTPTTTAPITNYIPALQTAAANVARFDHDTVTGESKGLLIEEQRTNLLTYSEQFDNAAWSKTRSSIVANAIVAPDGTLTGDKLVEDTTASNTHQIDQTGITVVSGTTYACSFYLKAAERTKARIVYLSGSSGILADVDLSAGTIGAAAAFNTATAVSSSIQSVGNGWYKCTVVGSQSVGTSGEIRVELLDASRSRTYTGNGYSGIYLWGAQLEAGGFPTSYIPTVASQVTRSADSASMTGSNFSSWYRADEGTVYAEFAKDTSASNVFAVSINDNSISNRQAIIYASTSQLRYRSITSGTNDVAINITASASGFIKAAGSYKVNDFAFNYMGGVVGTDTSAAIPPVTRLDLGAEFNNTSILNGTIKRIAFWPKRLSNTELQGLTS